MVGGAVAEGLAWQWIFWINIPIGLIVIPLVLGRIPESFGRAARLDIRGLVLVTGAALAIVWGLMRGNEVGWTQPGNHRGHACGNRAGRRVRRLGAAGRRADGADAPFPLARLLLGHRGELSILCVDVWRRVLPAAVLSDGQGFDPLGAGLRLLPWTATLFVFAPIGGSLVNRLGERPLVVGGLLMQALGFGWIGLIAAPDLAFAHLIPPLILAGAGVSMAMPAAQNAVLGAVAANEVGKASGIFNMSRFLGGTFGIALVVAVFAATGNVASATAFSAGFVAAIGVSAALSLWPGSPRWRCPASANWPWRRQGRAPNARTRF